MHHFDGFISYRRESGFFVAQTVKKLLEEKDIICHLDLEQDQVGEFDLRLLDAINNSSCLLLILTEGALDRCINEGDWVRREVMEALEKHIPIIPIEDRHFLWPVHLDDQFPKEFDRLKKMQRVPMVMEYLTAVIDKLATYMEPCIQRKIHKSSTVNEPPRATADFFLRGMNEPDLQGVDMAFHAGVEWRRVSEKVELLNQLIERNIPVRILVNSADGVEEVCSHMAQKGKEYVGFEENIKGWKKRVADIPCVSVRVLDVPLLHRLYILHRGDGDGYINVKYYTYGNYTPAKDTRRGFFPADAEYRLYVEEFEYLWRIARDVEEF